MCAWVLGPFLAMCAQDVTIRSLDTSVDGVGGAAVVGPEFVARDASIDDVVGNDDGVANAGETLVLRVRLRNAGVADASGVAVSIATDDPWVTEIGPVYSPAVAWNVGLTRTVSTYVRLATDAPTHEVATILTLTAENGGPWHFLLTFHVTEREPDFVKVDAWSDDPIPGADANGEANPGERIYVGLHLLNDSPTEASDVRLSLTALDPDVTVVVGEGSHTAWPGGEERETEFVVDIADAAAGHDAPLFISAVTDGGGIWQFSVVVTVVGPDPVFVVDDFWTVDPAPYANGDGLAAPGEHVSPQVRLRNDGDVNASDVRVTLSTDDPDLTVGASEYRHAVWPSAAAVTVDQWLVWVAPDAQPHDATLFVDVVDGGGSARRFELVLTIITPSIEFVDRNFWLFDPAAAGNGNGDGVANPAERIQPRVRLKHAGLDTAGDVTVTLTTTDPDIVVVAGSVTHDTWDAGEARNNVGFTIEIARNATPHDATLEVTVTAAHSGPWQFSFAVPIVHRPVEFVLRNSWVFDPAPGGDRDGLAEAGETVSLRVRLRNVGIATAENVKVAITVPGQQVAVVTGEALHATWAPGVARNNETFALALHRGVTPREVEVTVDVTMDNGAPRRFVTSFAIHAPPIEIIATRVALYAGGGMAGGPSIPLVYLKHIGTQPATNVRVALVLDDPDIAVTAGQVTLDQMEPGSFYRPRGLEFVVADDAMERPVSATITVSADGGYLWTHPLTFSTFRRNDFVFRNANLLDVVEGSVHDSKTKPGDEVYVQPYLRHNGPSVATNVTWRWRSTILTSRFSKASPRFRSGAQSLSEWVARCGWRSRPTPLRTM